jgi:hypothetical protein
MQLLVMVYISENGTTHNVAAIKLIIRHMIYLGNIATASVGDQRCQIRWFHRKVRISGFLIFKFDP